MAEAEKSPMLKSHKSHTNVFCVIKPLTNKKILDPEPQFKIKI